MPTFDFHCPSCNHTFEETIGFGVKKLPPCPKCHAKKVEKLLSMPGIAFKGGGFYKNDSVSPPATPHPHPLPKGEGVQKPTPPPTAPSPNTV